ncbi:hypothetical protein [Hyphomonas sp.]|uniref:hypothetical protein n=1 Tax=Hyphomonas sp. TaxID=87 RepID=UPI003001C042
MSMYYSRISDRSKISTRSGTNVVLPTDFSHLTSLVIGRCSYLQSLIQEVIYASHGPEIRSSKTALAENPNPKARMEFLCSFEYKTPDPVIATVFEYAQKLFRDIYELRCVLAHENWMSSDDFEGVVLFSELGEEARRLMISAKVEYNNDTTPKATFDGIMRYIQKIKVVSPVNLRKALQDTDLCSWILMTISHLLKEADENKKIALRETFSVFGGTAHLFEQENSKNKTVSVRSLRTNSIKQ